VKTVKEESDYYFIYLSALKVKNLPKRVMNPNEKYDHFQSLLEKKAEPSKK